MISNRLMTDGGSGPILRLGGAMGRQFLREIGTSCLPVRSPFLEAFDAEEFGTRQVLYLDGRRLALDAKRRLAEWISRESPSDVSFRQAMEDIEQGKVAIPVADRDALQDDPLAWG